ncbi:MAG TPA: hypothetical protein VFL81_02015 [Candidatus Saccharimonadales bacterium]|nr:hypothetical protein [Candidatus Saccharimonadales bacterium]
MSERLSDGDQIAGNPPSESEAKIYHWPKQIAYNAEVEEELPTPELITSNLDKIALVYSRWMHPSIEAGRLAGIIADQQLDGSDRPLSQAWAEAIEDLTKHSSLFNDYDELIADPTLAELERLAKSLNIRDDDERAVKQAVMVLMDLRSYGAKAGLHDRTLEVCEKMLSGHEA